MEEMIIVSSVSTVLLFMLKQWNDGFDSCMFHSSVIRVKNCVSTRRSERYSVPARRYVSMLCMKSLMQVYIYINLHQFL